jgi:hypothetical protein
VSGVKIDLAHVIKAEGIVDQAVQQMGTIAGRVNGQAALSEAAILAPAGGITSSTYSTLGAGGRALAETLAELKADLGKLRAVAEQGSDQATSAANTGAGGSSVSAGMA